jgi:hypothetical protein
LQRKESGVQIFAYLRLDSAVREKMRQGEFCNKDGMKTVGFPVKGKGRAWGRGLTEAAAGYGTLTVTCAL